MIGVCFSFLKKLFIKEKLKIKIKKRLKHLLNQIKNKACVNLIKK